jgi:hypothetical protein
MDQFYGVFDISYMLQVRKMDLNFTVSWRSFDEKAWNLY